MISFDPPSTLI